MADKKEFCSDEIRQVHLAGDMMRFDSMPLQPEEEGKAPVPQSNVRVIRLLQGYPGVI